MSEKHILLIEDNPDDVVLTLRALKKNNIRNQVVVKADGVEALDYLLGPEAGELPVVVLLDIKMPRLDGLEVLRRLRAEERTRLLPVVILTSSREESDILNGYKLGANSYVVKPLDADQFSNVVAEIGSYWLTRNKTAYQDRS
jgi:two-component system response regulator